MKNIFCPWVCAFLIALQILGLPKSLLAAAEKFVREQGTEFLTYDELRSLSAADSPVPQGALRKKLDRFWITPVISNDAYYRQIAPHHAIHKKIGRSMILATWNIEKSIHMDRVINMLVSDKSFEIMIDEKKAPPGSNQNKRIHLQRKKLQLADVLILQEIEVGIKRSDYRDAAKALASALDMNYAYAPQYLEIDPVTLGTEKIRFADGSTDQEASDYFAVDPAQYKGVFGSAVLSRYPIKHVEIIPLKYQPYDWYWGEKGKTAYLERFRRLGTKTIFKNEITREIKIGGRIFFRVDLEVPELPEKTITIINSHLEIKCLPRHRARQMKEILSYIRDIKNPVVVAGDFNAAPQDLSNTSVTKVAERSIKNPTNWLGLAINTLSPHALLVNTSRGISNITKNFQDPTAKHIPIVAPNPTKKLFDAVEDYRFYDGGVFDFRGDKNRSVNGKAGTLSNSNQRDRKGFKTTFKVIRPIGHWVGKYRLDWFFVKSFLKTGPRDKNGPYQWAPHYGETFEELNTSLKEQLSDHHPSMIYLPFEEPNIK